MVSVINIKFIKDIIIYAATSLYIGSFRVVPGAGGSTLEHTPPRMRSAAPNTAASQHDSLPHSVHDPALREFWKPWLKILDSEESQRSPTSPRKNFYKVWVGRKTGIFSSWSYCLASVAGYPGAKFKGFYSLKRAQDFSPP